MAVEWVAGLGIFKTLFDSAKGLKDLNDATIRNAAVIDLQEKILTAQAQQTALVERIGDLEKEMARFETWETERQRYQLKDYGGSSFAYELKPDEARGEPMHRLCVQHVITRVKNRSSNSNLGRSLVRTDTLARTARRHLSSDTGSRDHHQASIRLGAGDDALPRLDQRVVDQIAKHPIANRGSRQPRFLLAPEAFALPPARVSCLRLDSGLNEQLSHSDNREHKDSNSSYDCANLSRARRRYDVHKDSADG